MRRAQRTASEIASGFRRELGPLLVRYRVGIATGEVLVTEIGHASFGTQGVMGETVNRAALLLREAGRSESGFVLCEETQRVCAGS